MTTTAPPRPRPRKKDPEHEKMWRVIERLIRVVHALTQRVKELEARAHYAVGNDPRSPRYRGGSRQGFRAAMKYELKRAAWKTAKRRSKTVRVVHQHRTMWGRMRSNPAGTIAMGIVRQPFALVGFYFRVILCVLLTIFLLVWLLWAALPGWAKNGLGYLMPASYGQACVLTVPAGGIQGVSYSIGAAVRTVEVSEGPSPDRIRDGLHALARGAGMAVETVQQAANGTMARPMETVDSTQTIALVAGSGCGSSCETAPAVAEVPSTGPLTDDQVAALALDVGWPEEEVATGRLGARVRAESTTDNGPNDPAARDYADGTHHGLLQLGTQEQKDYLAPGASAFDPRANLRAGRRLWEARGWQPWRASDAAHRQYLDEAQAAAQRVLAARASGGAVEAVPAATGSQPVGCTVPALQMAADGPGDSVEAGLAPRAAAARRAVLAAFPEVKETHGWGRRPNKTEHDDLGPNGEKAANAVDYMVGTDMALGDRIAAFHLAHWDALGVDYMIWNRRITSDGETWEPYDGSSPHTDHPHVTYQPSTPGTVAA